MDIKAAKHPEDVFGDAADRAALARRFRELAVQCHPDRGGDEETFKRLGELYRAGLEAVEAGTYGQRVAMTGAVLIQTKRHAYKVSHLASRGKIANIYAATYEGESGTEEAWLSVARDPREGPKLAKEATTLKSLLTANPDLYDMLSLYVPRYIEAFAYRRGRTNRQAIAYQAVPGLFSLRDVLDTYPNGCDAKDTAWMMRRLLFALALVHSTGWRHGAVTLDHVMIHPIEHGVLLFDWTQADQDMAQAKADVMAAAEVMLAITARPMPVRMERFLGALRKGHGLPNAMELVDEYDSLIVDLWGPRRYRPFQMGAAA